MTRKQKTALVFSHILTFISLAIAVFSLLLYISINRSSQNAEAEQQIGWGFAMIVIIPLLLVSNLLALLSGGGAIPLSLSLRKTENRWTKIAAVYLSVLDIVSVVAVITLTVLLFIRS